MSSWTSYESVVVEASRLPCSRSGSRTLALPQSGQVTSLPTWSGAICMSVPHRPQYTAMYSGCGAGGEAGS